MAFDPTAGGCPARCIASHRIAVAMQGFLINWEGDVVGAHRISEYAERCGFMQIVAEFWSALEVKN
jgi:hypothetical protein